MFYFTSHNPIAYNIGYAANKYPGYKYTYIPSSYSSKPKSLAHVLSKVNRGNAVSLNALEDKSYSDKIEVLNTIMGFEVVRRGVHKGPNSFARILAGVLVDDSLGMSEYVKKTGKYATQLRKTLSKSGMEIYKQSLYDMTNDEIRERLLDENEFFDPLLYKAGAEDYFNIDIYIIRAEVISNNTIYSLVQPRHAQSYCDYSKRRKCIVIILNYGVSANMLKYPHCELLVPNTQKASIRSGIYSVKVSKRLHAIMQRCNKSLSFSGGSLFSSQSMNSNMIYVLDRLTERGAAITSQYIDTYGKTRGFTIKDGDVHGTILCHPCAPINVPHSNIILRTPISWIVNLCGNDPYTMSPLGVYCTDRETGENLYVRTDKNMSLDLDVDIAWDPFGELDEQVLNTNNIDRRMAEHNKLSRVLKSVFKWLYEVWSATQPHIIGSSLLFMRETITYMDPAASEDAYYNISNISIKLPEVTNISDALKYLTEQGVFIIKSSNAKIVLHSKKYKESIEYILKRYESVLYTSSGPSKHIKDYYISPYDFAKKPNTVILLGDTNPLASDQSYTKHSFQTYLDPMDLAKGSQILYATSDILYILQPTIFGNVKAAYNTSLAWLITGTNTPDADEEQVDITKEYVVYGVQLGNVLPIKHVHAISTSDTESDEDINGFVEILEYMPGKYAAMLRI